MRGETVRRPEGQLWAFESGPDCEAEHVSALLGRAYFSQRYSLQLLFLNLPCGDFFLGRSSMQKSHKARDIFCTFHRLGGRFFFCYHSSYWIKIAQNKSLNTLTIDLPWKVHMLAKNFKNASMASRIIWKFFWIPETHEDPFTFANLEFQLIIYQD